MKIDQDRCKRKPEFLAITEFIFLQNNPVLSEYLIGASNQTSQSSMYLQPHELQQEKFYDIGPRFACHVANYKIPESDVNKCMTNFYMYAREISNMRESLKSPDQKAMFDLEVHGIFCLCDVQDNYSELFCPN